MLFLQTFHIPGFARIAVLAMLVTSVGAEVAHAAPQAGAAPQTGAPQADAPAQQARSRQRKLAEAALRKWHARPSPRCSKDGADSCEHWADVLDRVAKVFIATNQRPRALAVFKELNNSAHGLARTQQAADALDSMARIYQSIADFERAAQFYELFVKRSPKSMDAPSALHEAIVIRLRLSHTEDAIRDARLHRRMYGRSRPAQYAHIAFALGRHLLERGDAVAAARELRRALRQIDKHGEIWVRFSARAALASAYRQQGNTNEANRTYRQLIDHYQPATIGRSLTGATQALRDRQLAKVLVAVSEAHTHFADQAREQLTHSPPPRFTGSIGHDTFQKHIDDAIRPWLFGRTRAVAEVERLYVRLLDLTPTATPKGSVHANASTAMMWEELSAVLGEFPVPNPKDPWYRRQLNAIAKPLKRRALDAYRECARQSLAVQHTDAYARRCQTWLARHDGQVLPADELLPQPHFVSGFAGRRPSPLPRPAPADGGS